MPRFQRGIGLFLIAVNSPPVTTLHEHLFCFSRIFPCTYQTRSLAIVAGDLLCGGLVLGVGARRRSTSHEYPPFDLNATPHPAVVVMSVVHV